MTPQTTNRLTAAIAMGVFLILAVLLASFSSRQSSDALLRRPSTFFTDPSGARALFLVMKQFLPATAQWRRPFQYLPKPGSADAASTLIAAGPARPLSGSEVDHLDRWLASGGQLILLTANGWPMRPRMSSNDADSIETPAQNDAEPGAMPMLLSRYAGALHWTKEEKLITGRAAGSSIPNGEITLAWRRGFTHTGGAKVVASAGNTAVAVEIPVGQGRIIAVADPTMASNGALRRSDNAVWLVSLAAGWGNGKILFDEYHHGFGQKRGAWQLTRAFFATPWGWCVLQVVAAGLLYVFAYRRRFGRIRELPAPNRASPLELVKARAGVLQVAAAQGLAADLIVQHLSQNLGKAPSKTLDGGNLGEELQNLTGRRGANAPTAALHALLAKVRAGERLSDPQFVALGRAAGEIVPNVRNPSLDLREAQGEGKSR